MSRLISKKIKSYFFILAIFLVFFVPRLIYLGFDEWVDDSSLWDSRSEAFYEGITTGDLGETYQSYHPGVLVMWLSGGGKYTFYKLFEIKNGYSVVKDTRKVYPEQFYIKAFFAKLPLVFAISLLLTFSSTLLYKIHKSKPLAIVFAIALSLEPFYLGVSRHLHLSGLFSAFVFTVITLAIYNIQTKLNKFFPYYLGVLLGLAFLTKVSTLILFPFLVGLYYYEYKKFDKAFFILLFKVLVTFFITIAALWPAIWVRPWYAFERLYVEGVVENVREGSSSTHLLSDNLFYIEEFFSRQTIFTVIFFIASLYFYSKSADKKIKYILTVFIAFIIYYIVAMTLPSKLNDRYFVVAMPFVIFCSSFALIKFFGLVKQPFVKYLIITVIVIYYINNLYCYFPSYSAYISDNLFGMRGVSKLMEVRNTGEYYLEAVRYLRISEGSDLYNRTLQVENTRKLRSSKGYYGKIVYTGHDFDKDSLDYFLVDYLNLQKVPQNCTIEKSFGPRGVFKFNYLYLYKCN